jgi:hypothetical protein
MLTAGTAAGASTLTAQLDVHASWPNVDLLELEDQQRFRYYETGATASADLQVDPLLPVGKDVTAPRVSLTILDEWGAAGARVDLALRADADASLMYLREWTLDPESKKWTVARDSGWIPYAPALTWELSNAGGVKYLGAWVRDAAGNGSTLDEASLDFTNRLIEDGMAVYNLLIASGQADLYAWLPGQSGPPAYAAEGSGFVKTIGFPVMLEGLYLLEAAAATDSTYTLLDATRLATAQVSEASDLLAPPENPLTHTTPLTAGAGAAPVLDLRPTYLPLLLLYTDSKVEPADSGHGSM